MTDGLGRVLLFQRVVQGADLPLGKRQGNKTHLLSGRIRPSLRGRSRSRHRPHYHDPRSQWQGADGRMPAGTGHGHRAVPHRPLPGMGEGLKLRWFTGDWLLVQGNGEILSDDFAQLINRNTREVLRIRRECSAGRKCSTLEYLPMARWSSSPGGIGLGRYFVIPSTSGASCGRQTSPKSWNGGTTKKCTRICQSIFRPRPRSEKSFSKKTA